MSIESCALTTSCAFRGDPGDRIPGSLPVNFTCRSFNKDPALAPRFLAVRPVFFPVLPNLAIWAA